MVSGMKVVNLAFGSRAYLQIIIILVPTLTPSISKDNTSILPTLTSTREKLPYSPRLNYLKPDMLTNPRRKWSS